MTPWLRDSSIFYVKNISIKTSHIGYCENGYSCPMFDASSLLSKNVTFRRTESEAMPHLLSVHVKTDIFYPIVNDKRGVIESDSNKSGKLSSLSL